MSELSYEQEQALEHCRAEVRLGLAAQQAYDSYFQAFLDKQNAYLFETFKAVALEDTVATHNLKTLQMALTELEVSIKLDISNGTHAQMTLDNYKED